MEIITGYFTSRERGIEAAEYLRAHGFEGRVSVLGRNSEEDNDKGIDRNSFSEGIAAAGVAAVPMGVNAYMSGAGPAFTGGSIFAAGPIAGMFHRVWDGSLAGILGQWGVPEEVGNEIKDVIEAGNTAILVECNQEQKWNVHRMLEQAGAQNIHI